ncbi:MAG: hypothetical protein NDJ89_12155 [Oligoflexia bacterium]|nr:hypothetical protein [Oligoflexia bacterium]
MPSDRHARKARFGIPLASGLALLASGCGFTERLEHEWKLVNRYARRAFPALRPLLPAASPRPEARLLGDNAQRALENRELLREIFAIALGRDPMSPNAGNRSEFSGLLATLNQGASLEGIYNGLTHSSDYRELELSGGQAVPAQLRVFSGVLGLLEPELPAPTVFRPSDARPLKVLSLDSLLEEPKPEPAPSFKPGDTASIFAGASVYTLKRVAGDEAMKVIAAKQAAPEKLADWYGTWAVRMLSFGVDFGIDLRNKPEEGFHRHWARQAPQDRLLWEVLNRVHRVLNAAGASVEARPAAQSGAQEGASAGPKKKEKNP